MFSIGLPERTREPKPKIGIGRSVMAGTIRAAAFLLIIVVSDALLFHHAILHRILDRDSEAARIVRLYAGSILPR